MRLNKKTFLNSISAINEQNSFVHPSDRTIPPMKRFKRMLVFLHGNPSVMRILNTPHTPTLIFRKSNASQETEKSTASALANAA